MNYTPFHLTQLTYLDFIPGIEKQYNIEWPQVRGRIYSMLRKTFEAANFTDTGRSKALYAIDMMLDQDFQPKILGIVM